MAALGLCLAQFTPGATAQDLPSWHDDPVVGGIVSPSPVSSGTVYLALRQVDNNKNLRSCGSAETSACTDVVRKFRATVTLGNPTIKVDLLLKAWRKIDGKWVESSSSPFRRYALSRPGTVNINPLCAKAPAQPHSGCSRLLAGLWRFQVQVPKASNGSTTFAASNYQYVNLTN